MLAYPITLEKDARTWIATSPDFPELTIFVDNRLDAVARSAHAFEEAIAARIHDRKDIPTPSRGDTYAILPTLTSVKVMLYQEMREQRVSKAELARRTGWHLPQVDRALDVQHRSRFDMMDAALAASGRNCPWPSRQCRTRYSKLLGKKKQLEAFILLTKCGLLTEVS